jgi:hypothetical protein
MRMVRNFQELSNLYNKDKSKQIEMREKNMATKNQHYVPRVYLKAWETRVVSKREPKKPFQGVYYYDKKDLETGDGRNKDSILYLPRLYNINSQLFFMIHKYPKIQEDVINQVMMKLSGRKVDTFFQGKQLNTFQDFAENFNELNEWEFIDQENPEDTISKKAVINDINNINSYVIENSFDSVVESKWEERVTNFLRLMETTVPINGRNGLREIEKNAVSDVVEMVIYLICRNPEFDFNGLLPRVVDFIFDFLPKAEDETEQQLIREEFKRSQEDAVWLGELYNGLFGVPRGYFHLLKTAAQSNLQLILYKCYDGQGSFITSDKPAFEYKSCLDTTNMNAIYCPLTPQYLLFMGRGEKHSLNKVDFRMATNEVIRKFNRIILNNATRAIISDKKHLGYII